MIATRRREAVLHEFTRLVEMLDQIREQVTRCLSAGVGALSLAWVLRAAFAEFLDMLK